MPLLTDVDILLNALAECQINQNESLFWDYGKLFTFYHLNRSKRGTLDSVLQIFFLLATSSYIRRILKKIYNINLEDVTFKKLRTVINANDFGSNDQLIKLLNKFVLAINFLIFWRNQKDNTQISVLTFLLQYRGLSQSGVSILRQMNLAPCPKTMAVKKKMIREKYGLPSTDVHTRVFWYDNMYRSLKGFFYDRNQVNTCYTVCSQTIVNMDPILLDPNFLGVPKVSSLFNRDFISQIQVEYRNSFCAFNFFKHIFAIPSITIPLKAFHNKTQYKFEELDLLPFPPGSISGTIKIFNHLKNQFMGINSEYYTFCTVDYDIYWRINRILYTNSLNRASFATVKRSMIVVLAPWHIIWKLSSKIWKFFLPSFIAQLIFSFDTRVSVNASFPTQLHVWMSLLKYKKLIIPVINNLTESHNFKQSLLYLIETLIPFVILAQLTHEKLISNFSFAGGGACSVNVRVRW